MSLEAIHCSRTLSYFEYARMSEATKTFQTLDSNSKILLIILKGNLLYVFKKRMFIKYLIVTKAK